MEEKQNDEPTPEQVRDAEAEHAEDLKLAEAAGVVARLLFSFDEHRRHALIQMMAPIVPDPEEAEERYREDQKRERDDQFWATLQNLVAGMTAAYTETKKRDAEAPRYQGAVGPCDCFRYGPASYTETRVGTPTPLREALTKLWASLTPAQATLFSDNMTPEQRELFVQLTNAL